MQCMIQKWVVRCGGCVAYRRICKWSGQWNKPEEIFSYIVVLFRRKRTKSWIHRYPYFSLWISTVTSYIYKTGFIISDCKRSANVAMQISKKFPVLIRKGNLLLIFRISFWFVLTASTCLLLEWATASDVRITQSIATKGDTIQRQGTGRSSLHPIRLAVSI